MVDVLGSVGGVCVEAILETVHTGKHLKRDLAPTYRCGDTRTITPLEERDSGRWILQNSHTSSILASLHTVEEKRNSLPRMAYTVDPLSDSSKRIRKEEDDSGLQAPGGWRR